MNKKPNYYNHNGFLMPMGFPIEGFTSALQYQAQESDIFLVTYPKCGTTWTQYILWLMQHQGEPLSPSEKLETYIPHLEEVGKETVEKLPKPRVIKTHLPYNLTPYNPQAKYIYVARNPFDCLVSFYHLNLNFGNCLKPFGWLSEKLIDVGYWLLWTPNIFLGQMGALHMSNTPKSSLDVEESPYLIDLGHHIHLAV